MFHGKTILVTGGTGSFGHDFIRLALSRYDPARVIVYSRDEKKQYDMRLRYHDERLAFVIGDIRDRHHIASAMRGVNYVFHAAALKQVPSCEFFPMEAVQTNIIGTHHVLEAAEQNGVEKLVVLSTDKAVYPINAMGQSKALMEKLMLARSQQPQTTVTFCGVRYGNVMYSRGSVIPLFIDQIKTGQPLTVTHPDMTRLLLPLAEAVELVTFAMEHGAQGDMFVRKAATATVGDLAQALLNLFESHNPIQSVGIRAGEKMHEVLVTAEEFARAEEFDDYYRIFCQHGRDYDQFFTRGIRSSPFAREGYTSENARRLSLPEIEQLLLQLPEIRAELAAWPMPTNSLKMRRAA
ncbi:MAG: polysaccharide biosynthesis protein [Planctomycetes bacterium]|nr:polysaccharide biosynthesis protein [Planctomycetota bacterium]